ncbi:MAG: hypothetical protein SFY70_01795 [Bacteroidia bacterium]|nr:hypothetical protein [Bacteroidia bacterium]
MIYTQRGQRGLPYDSVVYVIPQENTSPEQYGQNFIRAYRAAAQKRPGGLPLSATNRASVVVLGCLCRWGSGEFVMDTNFVDIIGIDPATCVLESPGTTVATTADDYRIVGLTLRTTGTQPTRPTPASPAAYFPQGPSGGHVLENVVLEQTQLLANLTRYGEGYSGRYQVEAKAPSGASVYCFEGTCTGTFTFEMTLNNAGVCFLLGGAEFTASPKYDRIDISFTNALTTSVVNLFGRSFSGRGDFLRVRFTLGATTNVQGTINCAVAGVSDPNNSTTAGTATTLFDLNYVEFEAREINAFACILNPASSGAALVGGLQIQTFKARFNTLRAFAVNLGLGSAIVDTGAVNRPCLFKSVQLERVNNGAPGGELFLFAVKRQIGLGTAQVVAGNIIDSLEIFPNEGINSLNEIMWFGTGVAGVNGAFNGIARNFRLRRSTQSNNIRSKVTAQFGRGTNVSSGELYNWDTLTGVSGPCSMLFDNCLVRGRGATVPIADARGTTLIARNTVFLAETPAVCVDSTTPGVQVRLEGCLLNKAAPLGVNVTNLTPTGTFIDTNLQ